jgi:bifunctional DNA-binding transcriptional regulator/antitoxin component of YhaV-PrlF toxin-antitoxin module
MRLQGSPSRRLGSKQYVKHQVVIPNSDIKQLGWKAGDYLERRITAKGLFLCKVDPRLRTKEPEYEEFKQAVTRTLAVLEKGCTWSELRLKADLAQRTPSPIWVTRMEDEGILKRARDHVTSRTIWKLSQEQPVPPIPSTLNGWTQKSAAGDRYE